MVKYFKLMFLFSKLSPEAAFRDGKMPQDDHLKPD